MINNTQDIDRTITTKFIEPLEKSCKNSVKRLKTAKVKHIESIRLINQAYKTIKNSEKNLNKYNFVDSYTLLRASLEYIVMSYMIEVEEKTYNEFLILSNNDIQLKRNLKLFRIMRTKSRLSFRRKHVDCSRAERAADGRKTALPNLRRFVRHSTVSDEEI